MARQVVAAGNFAVNVVTKRSNACSADFWVSAIQMEILSKVVDGVSSGGFLSDAIDEGHAIDDLDDQLSPVQCSPLFLRGQGQLEDHR